MAEPKILTDLKIGQCPVWSSKTEYLFRDKGSGSTVFRLYRLLKRSHQYDVVVLSNIKTAQIFGFLKRVFKWKRPKVIILELMLDEARNDFSWTIKNLFQRFSFASIETIFVSSKREIPIYASRLKLPISRISFLPFHTNVVEPRMIHKTNGYIFSAGRTGRDFATLAAAVDGLDIEVVVVSDRHHAKGIDFPENVEVYIDIPYKRYMALLHNAGMVVVPLKKVVKSTGQVVFLEAMALGKPVIATNTVGSEDYIEHGKTGVLVPPEDIGALKSAIANYIEEPDAFKKMAECAFRQIKTQHTFEVYTRRILEEAKRIAG